MNKPNILLIFTDQQRFDALGAAGNKVIRTPNMDSLAKEGRMYSSCMSPSPLCQPARACVVNGLTAGRLGCLENNVPRSYDPGKALPRLLHDAGYYCKAVGKMHFSNKPYEVDYGMDDMVLSEETRGVRFTKQKEDVVFDDYDKFLIRNHRWGWDKPTEIGYNEIKPLLNPLPPEYHVTRWCGDEAVKFLKTQKKADKPFFLWTSFVKPHVPYDCPRHLATLYDPSSMPRPWVSGKDGTADNPYIQSYRVANEFDLYSEHARNLALAYYYANITFIDEEIGKLLATLREIGKDGNTIVIFTSDHGDMMGDHGLFYKCFGFEGSMHVPLIIRYPGRVAAGSREERVVSLLDLYPTLLNLAGVPWDAGTIPGEDLLSASGRDFAFSEVLYPPYYLAHVRTKEWKYLFYQNGGREALYHLSEDPHELDDLSLDCRYASVLQELRQKGEEYVARNGSVHGVLDEGGHFIHEELHGHGPSASPFSRMPWDYRIPPVDVKEGDLRKTFWNGGSEDWSDHLRK